MDQNKNKKILIAEDDRDLLDMYTHAFEVAGFEVVATHDGKEAWEYVKKNFSTIDLIILDIIMPNMDGFDFLGRMQEDENYKKIPIIVSTNLDHNGDRDAALALGAKKYFVKSSATPQQLVTIIKEELSKSSSTKKKII